MPNPVALCLEDLSVDPPTYLSCVALAGNLPGLCLDESGEALWRSDRPARCELWVSGDEQLMLLRPEGAGPVRVHRAGRHLDAPCEQPVVLIDQDEITVGARRLRVHVHGPAPAVTSPVPIVVRAAGLAASAASLLAVGAVVAACDREIEVRDAPPSVEVLVDGGPPGAAASATVTPDAGSPAPSVSATAPSAAQPPPSATTPVPVTTNRPIVVRPSPPKMAAPEPPVPPPPPIKR